MRLEDRVFDALAGFIEANGYPPSVRELMRLCGYRSPSAVHRLLGVLESQGRISRASGLPRTISIKKAS